MTYPPQPPPPSMQQPPFPGPQPPQKPSGMPAWAKALIAFAVLWSVAGMVFTIYRTATSPSSLSSHSSPSFKPLPSTKTSLPPPPLPKDNTPQLQPAGEQWKSYMNQPAKISGPAGPCRSTVEAHRDLLPQGWTIDCVNYRIDTNKNYGRARVDTYGDTNPALDNHTIRLSIPVVGNDKTLDTLWHEVGHAIQFDYFSSKDNFSEFTAAGQNDDGGPYAVNADEQWARAYALCLGGFPPHAPFTKHVSCDFVNKMRQEILNRTGFDISHVGTGRH